MAARTIEEVLAELDGIIAWAKAERSRLGYFPALYRRVTARVKEGIAAGRFEDGARMERLDVAFANRYLEAFSDWRAGRMVTGSWRAAFEAGGRWSPLILQHLLAGMNAHILLDLGIAAAEVGVQGLERDFAEINSVLNELTQGVEDEVGALSPWIGLLETMGGKVEDRVVEFSMAVAREKAWSLALELAEMDEGARAERIALADTRVEVLGRLIVRPKAGLLFIRLREESDAVRVIEVLTDPLPV